MKEPEMERIGAWVAEILTHVGNGETEQKIRRQVAELAARFPVYEARVKGGLVRAEHARV
jgi:glycine hydroxymethyltransferase